MQAQNQAIDRVVRKKVRNFGILAVIIVLCGIAGYRLSQRHKPAATRGSDAPVVQVSEPVRQDLRQVLEFTGDIVAIKEAGIFSKVSGNVEQVLVNIGSPVHENQLLALIDTTELSQAYEQASATYLNAKLTFDRTKDLYNQNLAAKQDYDNAEAALRVAQAARDGAATRLAYARITAPFSGVITRRYLDPGALVSPGSTTLFTLMSLDSVKVIINVLERDIPRVSIGMPTRIAVDAYPGRDFQGVVTRLSQAVDPATRTMTVEIDIPNREHTLKPGMFARVVLVLGEHRHAMMLPETAVLKDDKGNYVYVVRADTAYRQAVQTGLVQDSHTEILSGLSDSSRVVVTGQQFARDRSPVVIQR
jgi:RND family efflux transporter MFP subunit